MKLKLNNEIGKIIVIIYNENKIELPRWLSGKESTRQCRSCRFDPWARKILWRRKWKPTPVFLPGKSNGQKSLEGAATVHGVAQTVRHTLATK